MTPTPRWSVPAPYGQAAAIESMGSIAAPLLAGFSATLAALVIQDADSFRWASIVLALLIGAVLSLLAVVQLTFHARQFSVTPSEMMEWWPDSESDPARREMLEAEQRLHRTEQQRWSNRARVAYEIGLLSFLLGIAGLLVPPGHITTGRLAAIALALAGFLGEFAWIVRNRLSS